MTHTNGFHSAPSMMDLGITDTMQRRSSLNDSSASSASKRLKPNHIVAMAETQSMKAASRKSRSLDVKNKNLVQSDSNNNTDSIKSAQEHIPSTSSPEQAATRSITNGGCRACGGTDGDRILCHICQASFHLRCASPPLSEEDIPKESYFCDSCRTRKCVTEEKDKQQKLILPFRFTPKKKLQDNGVKKGRKHRSKLERVEVPTGKRPTLTSYGTLQTANRSSSASNGPSVTEPSEEIETSAITNTIDPSDQSSASTTHLKRKRVDSSPIPSPPSATAPIADPQLDVLQRLLLSGPLEEFHGPASRSSSNVPHRRNCFTCEKASATSNPMIQCDYCRLSYHLACLTPPLLALPTSHDRWMCPNHSNPALDHHLSKTTLRMTRERVKLHHQQAQMRHNTIVQEFDQQKPNRTYLFANTISNHRSERVDISRIPRTIEELYERARATQQESHEVPEEDTRVQTTVPCNESSSAYDPCVWDVLQAIVHHVADERNYEFSPTESASLENDQHSTRPALQHECRTLDSIDVLLQALHQLNDPTEHCTDTLNPSLPTPATLASSPLTNAFSLPADLSQFRSSHAALIHTQSQHVIYIRKHVVWFGSSSLNDICLTDFDRSHSCEYVSERHACLYYDRKRNLFELLNYSEFGTTVNNLRYGFDLDDGGDESGRRRACSCRARSFEQPAWDGPASIEQGTVIDIGCHQFLFYRHIVR